MRVLLVKKTVIISLFIVFLSIFFPTLIAGSNLPDGLFWSKELLYLGMSSLSIFFISILFFILKQKYIRVHLIDILIFIYLLYRSVISYLLFPIDGFPTSIYINIAILYCYIIIRVAIQLKEVPNKLFAIALVVTLIAQITYGLLQSFGLTSSFHSYFPVTGAYFNPAPYSLLLSICLPFSVRYTYIIFKNKGYSSALFGLILIQSLAIYLIIICFSRGNWISVILSTFIFIIIQYGKNKWSKIRKITIPFLILLIPVAIYFYQLKPISANGRILIWQISFEVIKSNIIFGVGEGNFAFNFLNYQHKFFASSTNVKKYGATISDIRFAFNDLLQEFAEDGVIGFIIFLFIFVAVLKILFSLIKGYKNNIEKRSFFLVLLLMLCILIVGGLFSYPLSLFSFKIILFSIFALTVNSLILFNKKKAKIISISSSSRYFLSAFTFVISLTIFWNTQRIFSSLLDWRDSVIHSEPRQVILLERIKPILGNNGYFLYYLGSLYLKNKDYIKAFEYFKKAKLIYPFKDVYLGMGNALIKLDKLKEAEQEYIFLIEAFPNEIEFYLYLARFYSDQKKYDLLKEIKSKIQTLKPGNNLIHFRKIQSVINNL